MFAFFSHVKKKTHTQNKSHIVPIAAMSTSRKPKMPFFFSITLIYISQSPFIKKKRLKKGVTRTPETPLPPSNPRVSVVTIRARGALVHVAPIFRGRVLVLF